MCLRIFEFAWATLGQGVGGVRRGPPLTSNLWTWNPDCAVIWTSRILVCARRFWVSRRRARFGLGWPEFVGGVDPTCHKELWACVLCVRWVWWAPLLFSPPRTGNTLRKLHTSYSGTGLVCGVHGGVRKQHFDCSGVGLYNFKDCLDFLHLVDDSLDTA